MKKQQKLVEANETTITDQEQELETAVKCLKLIFGNNEEQFLDDNRIDYEKVRELYTEMKKVEKEKLKNVQAKAPPVNEMNDPDNEDDQANLITLLQEESKNIKNRIIDLTELNNKLQREANRAKEQAAFYYQQIIDKKDQEISKLQNIVYQQTNEQGKQLLEALKTGQPPSSSKPSVQQLNVSPLDESSKTEMSDNSNTISTQNQSKSETSRPNSGRGGHSMEEQIKQLSEKLRFANETIAHLVDKEEDRQQEKEEGQKMDPDAMSQSSFSILSNKTGKSGKSPSAKQLSAKQMNESNYETELLPPEML